MFKNKLNAPKSFVRHFNKKERRKSSVLLGMFKKDLDEEKLDITLPNKHKHSAEWEYW